MTIMYAGLEAKLSLLEITESELYKKHCQNIPHATIDACTERIIRENRPNPW